MKTAKISVALILHFVSIVVVFESLFMLLAVAVSFYYRESITCRFFLTFIGTLLFGVLLNILTRKKRYIEPSKRESFVIVSLGWILMGLVGTLPYLATQSIPQFTNAFFESISGFTTTGSSILADIELLPKSILFWRAETHWIGGMGIIVLVIAIMPFLKINGIYLFYSEISSVANEKVSTRIKNIARNLWLIYIGLTFVETILLWVGGMPLFDSVCHSFATIATGGFSTQNDSIAGYSPFVQYIIAFFMMMSGINFTVHFLMLNRKFKSALKNEELRLYLKIILFVGGIITLLLFFQHRELGFERAFRSSFFQVISIITATGFATADYLQWPVQAVGLIAILMLIGASSGSTGGGIKVIRHLIAFKKIRQGVTEIIYPNTVKVVRYNGKHIQKELVQNILTFIFFYYLIVAVGTFVMMFWTNDLATSFGAVATSMAGIGPGFGTVGPVSNFLHLPTGAKYFLALLMVVGRLEIYSLLVIFTPSFWRD
ncbi:TrkH family potassium uptake protein [Prolixibacteraceae bacterium Z1-6]|uniref:TrkH family potassium uptake protein n=1 Tax=Draconibacterium aestuarii TaxID=2998507 RepID=A0A9X3FAU2_9BACT|nr:TrkH family potassium uptake protein [Prolixibacteraceae bacterium Z1-6]